MWEGCQTEIKKKKKKKNQIQTSLKFQFEKLKKSGNENENENIYQTNPTYLTLFVVAKQHEGMGFSNLIKTWLPWLAYSTRNYEIINRK